MTLITGPAWAGKTEYCRAAFGLTPEEILDGMNCTPSQALRAVCICRFHLFLCRLTEQGYDAVAFTRQMIQENPNCTIVLDEIGCGIVPAAKAERMWREQTGRCGCLLAEHAETVIRLYCGIPAAIKGELL